MISLPEDILYLIIDHLREGCIFQKQPGLKDCMLVSKTFYLVARTFMFRHIDLTSFVNPPTPCPATVLRGIYESNHDIIKHTQSLKISFVEVPTPHLPPYPLTPTMLKTQSDDLLWVLRNLISKLAPIQRLILEGSSYGKDISGRDPLKLPNDLFQEVLAIRSGSPILRLTLFFIDFLPHEFYLSQPSPLIELKAFLLRAMDQKEPSLTPWTPSFVSSLNRLEYLEVSEYESGSLDLGLFPCLHYFSIHMILPRDQPDENCDRFGCFTETTQPTNISALTLSFTFDIDDQQGQLATSLLIPREWQDIDRALTGGNFPELRQLDIRIVSPDLESDFHTSAAEDLSEFHLCLPKAAKNTSMTLDKLSLQTWETMLGFRIQP